METSKIHGDSSQNHNTRHAGQTMSLPKPDPRTMRNYCRADTQSSFVVFRTVV